MGWSAHIFNSALVSSGEFLLQEELAEQELCENISSWQLGCVLQSKPGCGGPEPLRRQCILWVEGGSPGPGELGMASWEKGWIKAWHEYNPIFNKDTSCLSWNVSVCFPAFKQELCAPDVTSLAAQRITGWTCTTLKHTFHCVTGYCALHRTGAGDFTSQVVFCSFCPTHTLPLCSAAVRKEAAQELVRCACRHTAAMWLINRSGFGSWCLLQREASLLLHRAPKGSWLCQKGRE